MLQWLNDTDASFIARITGWHSLKGNVHLQCIPLSLYSIE
jgi:hypothetical protein